MEIIVTIISIIVTTISIGLAIYYNLQYKKLEDYNLEEAWETYRQALNVHADIEKILKASDNIEIQKAASSGKSRSAESIATSIRLIKRFEKKFNEKTIASWRQKGRIVNEDLEKLFISFSDE